MDIVQSLGWVIGLLILVYTLYYAHTNLKKMHAMVKGTPLEEKYKKERPITNIMVAEVIFLLVFLIFYPPFGEIVGAVLCILGVQYVVREAETEVAKLGTLSNMR